MIAPADTLLWNLFRTFELLPPALWLRRLCAPDIAGFNIADRKHADLLTRIERGVARHVVAWLESSTPAESLNVSVCASITPAIVKRSPSFLRLSV
jgi:hypothetical protein